MARDDDARLVYSTGGDAPGKAGPRADAGHTERSGGGGVRIRLDRRAGGRLVTVVAGLGGAPDAIAALARALKAACGAGGTVKHGAIELQGDQRETAESELRARGFKPKRAGG